MHGSSIVALTGSDACFSASCSSSLLAHNGVGRLDEYVTDSGNRSIWERLDRYGQTRHSTDPVPNTDSVALQDGQKGQVICSLAIYWNQCSCCLCACL
mmetsp:Transcript_21783/g.62017  ORF Transcript_21783/g.62017 Transcript_21783/m.62017 type:complete len:98 (-) Transcript_21783:9-302(-)